MNTQTPFASGYFEELAGLYSNFLAEDKTGEPFDFDGAVEDFSKRALACRERGGTIYFVGNGGSSGVVSHMAADFTKNGRIPALTFTDNSLLTCISNDLGYENVYSEPISIIGKSVDMLVAVSSSGQSPNILNATIAAAKIGLEVVTLSGFEVDNPLRNRGDLRFYVPSKHYGFVEISHMAIIHCALDLIMSERIAQ